MTGPQRRELERLAREPQPTYGSSTTRVQNTLVRMGLAYFANKDGSTATVPTEEEARKAYGNCSLYDRCAITEAGRAALFQEQRDTAPAPAAERRPVTVAMTTKRRTT